MSRIETLADSFLAFFDAYHHTHTNPAMWNTPRQIFNLFAIASQIDDTTAQSLDAYLHNQGIL